MQSEVSLSYARCDAMAGSQEVTTLRQRGPGTLTPSPPVVTPHVTIVQYRNQETDVGVQGAYVVLGHIISCVDLCNQHCSQDS